MAECVKEQGHKFSFVSNGSQSPEYFKRIAPFTDAMMLSYHKAYADPEHFIKVKKENMDYLVNLNLRACFNIAQICAKKMLENKNRKKIGGAVVHISSMFGLVGGPNRTVYSMTKFGLEGLTRGMAVDLSKFNIRTNSVCPTFVETPRAKKYLANKKFRKYVDTN